MDIAHKVTVEMDKIDESFKIHLDPDILNRSEIYCEHKRANATLETAAAFNSDQTKLIQCQFPMDRFHLFDSNITGTSKSEHLYIWNPKHQKPSCGTYTY